MMHVPAVFAFLAIPAEFFGGLGRTRLNETLIRSHSRAISRESRSSPFEKTRSQASPRRAAILPRCCLREWFAIQRKLFFRWLKENVNLSYNTKAHEAGLGTDRPIDGSLVTLSTSRKSIGQGPIRARIRPDGASVQSCAYDESEGYRRSHD